MSQAPVHAETRSPLADPAWRYIEKPSIEAFSAEDWAVMARQRREFAAAKQADIVLAMLRVGEDEPTFGYQINNFRHCLQSASRVLRAGLDEETVAVALLHDIGFTACPATHGDFAAALLQPYIGARNHWMLEHHRDLPGRPQPDPSGRRSAGPRAFPRSPAFRLDGRIRRQVRPGCDQAGRGRAAAGAVHSNHPPAVRAAADGPAECRLALRLTAGSGALTHCTAWGLPRAVSGLRSGRRRRTR